MFKIYCAHPISGLGYDEVVEYYMSLKKRLEKMGYQVLHPMTGKNYLRNEIKFKAAGYANPVSTNHAITNRDCWMVNQSDVVYVNLLGAKIVSIGCVAELAWAWFLKKHVVVVMEENNIHRHCFILECATAIFETDKEAEEYLDKLTCGRI